MSRRFQNILKNMLTRLPTVLLSSSVLWKGKGLPHTDTSAA